MKKYDSIIQAIFTEHYTAGASSVTFDREELSEKALALHIQIPKNLGDVVYSYKFRKNLPEEIARTAPQGYYWRIRNAGRSHYEFVLEKGVDFIAPDPMLATIKIPDATPSIVKKYSASDEQALLAILRYNRLIDIFLGVTCYSLQNHLRTTVEGIGQIETDEIYVGIDQRGQQLIIPVQAKGGNDRIGVTQIEQDIALCRQKYPELICHAIACQFITRDEIAMFSFSMEDDRVVKNMERRYKMIDAALIGQEDLSSYADH